MAYGYTYHALGGMTVQVRLGGAIKARGLGVSKR